MKLQLDTGRARYVIRGYSASGVKVNDEELTRSFILTPDTLIADWAPQRSGEIAAEHVEQLVRLDPEVVIIGTGRRLRFPEAEVVAPLIAAGIGYEVMDTRSACRCYAVLVSEGRRVAGAILPPEAD
ncbi:MAG: hypothetical protein NFCOHLIN_00282 [Gammaproteobacteria bacterium]|nr:hypothetical protein [Gammaproteobacteria bacterium]